MAMDYQHSDEVIEAARVLRTELISDSMFGFGTEDEARKWFRVNYPELNRIANQTTESEEERATAKL